MTSPIRMKAPLARSEGNSPTLVRGEGELSKAKVLTSSPGVFKASVDMAGFVEDAEEEGAEDRNPIVRVSNTAEASQKRSSCILPDLARKLSPPPIAFEPTTLSTGEIPLFDDEVDDNDKTTTNTDSTTNTTLPTKAESSKFVAKDHTQTNENASSDDDTSEEFDRELDPSKANSFRVESERHTSCFSSIMPAIREMSRDDMGSEMDMANEMDASLIDFQDKQPTTAAAGGSLSNEASQGRRISSTTTVELRRKLSPMPTASEPCVPDNSQEPPNGHNDNHSSANLGGSADWGKRTGSMSPRPSRLSLRGSGRTSASSLPGLGIGMSPRRESRTSLRKSIVPLQHQQPSNDQEGGVPFTPSTPVSASRRSVRASFARGSGGAGKSPRPSIVDNDDSGALSLPGAFAVSSPSVVRPLSGAGSRRSMPAIAPPFTSENSFTSSRSPRGGPRRSVLEMAKSAPLSGRRSTINTDQAAALAVAEMDAVTRKTSGLELAPAVEPEPSTPGRHSRAIRRSILETRKAGAGDAELGTERAAMPGESSRSQTFSDRLSRKLGVDFGEDGHDEMSLDGIAVGMATSMPSQMLDESARLEHSSRGSDDSFEARPASTRASTMPIRPSTRSSIPSQALSRETAQNSALPIFMPQRKHLDFISEKLSAKASGCTRIFVILICIGLAGIVAGVVLALPDKGDKGDQADDSLPVGTEAPVITNPGLFEERLGLTREILSDIISSASDLDNLDSPQHLALTWLVEEDKLSPISEDMNETEVSSLVTRYVLAVFYYSLGGKTWFKSDGWLDGGAHACTWQYVNCTDTREDVEAIGPAEQVNLKGPLPSELRHLSQLRSLLLANNMVNGVNVTFGENLVELDLSLNDLKGEIPSMLYDTSSLEKLVLESNELTGTLSPRIGGLKNLQTLSLLENRLTGRLSTELHSLKALRYLDLSYNFFEANYGELIQGLSNLEYLRLGALVGITGSIPADIGVYSSLRLLELRGAGLTGNIPSEIGDLSNLVFLRIDQTYIEGSIPTSIGRLSNLELFSAEGSFLSGSLPSEIGNLGRLKDLHLLYASVSGSLPSEIGNMSSLSNLNFQSTLITGEIPPQIANITSLETLNIANTGLTGELPAKICDLPAVTSICVAIAGHASEVNCNCGGEICSCPLD